MEVQIGVSFVSIDNARLNLDTEQPGFDFERVRSAAKEAWNEVLSRQRPLRARTTSRPFSTLPSTMHLSTRTC